MLTVQAVGPAPRNGSAASPARFDVVRFEAAIEASVCRALREEMAGQHKGVANMRAIPLQIEKPAEKSPQQASGAIDCPIATSNVIATREICQEALNKVLAGAEEKARVEYDATLEASKLLVMEMQMVLARIVSVQSRLDEAVSETRQGEDAERSALEETASRAREALVPYVTAGLVSPDEVEMHLESALQEARERLRAARQDAILRLDSLRHEMEEVRLKKEELDFRQAALDDRLAQLRALPCIITLEQARREEEMRKAESAREAVRFLETAPWHELSWQKRLTTEFETVAALAREDEAVFDALVTRLGRELDQVDAARPGLGWSVVRAIDSLEIGRLFPALETRRAQLVQAARRHNRDGKGHAAMADKVVSLASHWGARVAGR